MLRYLFDTDHLTCTSSAPCSGGRRLASEPAGAVGISVVTWRRPYGADWHSLHVPVTGRLRIFCIMDCWRRRFSIFAQFPVVPL